MSMFSPLFALKAVCCLFIIISISSLIEIILISGPKLHTCTDSECPLMQLEYTLPI